MTRTPDACLRNGRWRLVTREPSPGRRLTSHSTTSTIPTANSLATAIRSCTCRREQHRDSVARLSRRGNRPPIARPRQADVPLRSDSDRLSPVARVGDDFTRSRF